MMHIVISREGQAAYVSEIKKHADGKMLPLVDGVDILPDFRYREIFAGLRNGTAQLLPLSLGFFEVRGVKFS